MSNFATVLGLDMGGAHLKAALLDESGAARWVTQLPCPLWRGLEYLEHALGEVLSKTAGIPTRLAITMTGELADIFTDRRDGVMRLTACASRRMSNQHSAIYAGAQGFVGAEDAQQHAANIASANWLASAEFVAAQVPDALFVDIGSTTTDMLAIRQGKVITHGYSDAERLRTQELVYSGVVRTPVMAVTNRIAFRNALQGIAAEHFATMSDVYRLTGELDEMRDMADTADGAGKKPEDSARRLARMVGCDVQDAGMADWQQLAEAFKQAQLDLLHGAAQAVAKVSAPHAPVIGAGAGRFLARQLAAKLGREYRDIADLMRGDAEVRQWAAVCAPAYAVAWLAQREDVWR